MSRDRLFLFFIVGIFIVLVLFGLGTALVIVLDDTGLGLRMVNVFASMFSATIGLGTGYLLGTQAAASSNGNGHGNGHAQSQSESESGKPPNLT